MYICIKVREHTTPQDDDHEPLWSFLVPVMADESEQRVQIFFQKKVLLNAASMPWKLILQLVHSLLKGSFFKSSARDLDLASLKEDTMMVYVANSSNIPSDFMTEKLC